MANSVRFGFILLIMLLAFSCKKNNFYSFENNTTGDTTIWDTTTLIQCNSNPSNPVFDLTTNDFNTNLPVGYDTIVCGIFPLGKNYKWIYKDSVFGNNGQFLKTEYDTLFVEKIVKFPGSEALWWKLKSSLGKQVAPNYYIYTTDSVMYFLEKSEGMVQNSTHSLYSNSTWLRLDGQKMGIITDIGYINNYFFRQTVSVPAGNFTNIIRCDKLLYNLKRIFFKPGIGFLKIEVYNSTNIPEKNKLQRISELVAFIH